MTTTSSEAPTTLALVRPPWWICYANEITCRHGHPLIFHRAGYHADYSRIDGFIWHACEMCKPTTFFFGIIYAVTPARGPGHIHFYEITREQYREWAFRPSTDEEIDGGVPYMLHALGYNPNFRPQRIR